MPRLPTKNDLRRLAKRLTDKEQLNRLKEKLPTRDDLEKLREHLPTRDDLSKLKKKLPKSGDVRRRLDVDKRVQRLKPHWSMVGWLLMQPLRLIAWMVGLIPLRVRLGVTAILAVWLGGSWWINRPAASEVAATTTVAPPEIVITSVIKTKPVPEPASGPKYVIHSGLYQQRLSPGSSPRYLLVKSNGRGQFIIHLGAIEALFIGARKVVIETTWTVDEVKAETTFVLNGGSPQNAYQNLLNGPLDKITRFRIKDFQENSLILQRDYDGEIFHWVRAN